jgi:hypothetical protein
MDEWLSYEFFVYKFVYIMSIVMQVQANMATYLIRWL